MLHNFTGRHQSEIIRDSALESSAVPRVFEDTAEPIASKESAISCRMATFGNPLQVGKKSGVLVILTFAESAESHEDSLVSCGVRFSAWGCGLSLETRAIVRSDAPEPVVLEFVPKAQGELTVEVELEKNADLLGRRRETLTVKSEESP